MGKHLKLGLSLENVPLDAGGLVGVVGDAERIGCHSVWTGEAYGRDAVVPLVWAAAHTSRIRLGTSVMQIPARTPAATAMTAMTLAELSGGRFVLGLGVSGPVVAEGWHGARADMPLRRTSEYVDLVRQALAGERPVALDGACHQVPYRGPGASGQAVPLRPTDRTTHPVPVHVGAVGPRNVRLAVAQADGLLSVLWNPHHWQQAYGADLLADAATDFEISARVWVALGDDLGACRDRLRHYIAFYIGAMGPPGRNRYAELIRSYGYDGVVEAVERCYAERRRGDAATHVTDQLVDEVGLCGPRGHVAEQLDSWRDSPVSTIIVDTADRSDLAMLVELAG